ncbi:DivIVA domain-containing protein [Kribbella sp. NPDC051718]|uniref:DivIVA domain-containing protein n=1 Tax=Kribbella sp. NPDC051718 TaxID=3155168 RepID=UPI0034195B2F
MWFFGLIVVLLIGAVAVVASGRWGAMAPAYDDRPDLTVPARQALTADDLAQARFGVGLRGYRMDEVDTLLERVGREVAERDRRIADLERAVSPIIHGPEGAGFTARADYQPTDFDDTGYNKPILVGGDFPTPEQDAAPTPPAQPVPTPAEPPAAAEAPAASHAPAAPVAEALPPAAPAAPAAEASSAPEAQLGAQPQADLHPEQAAAPPVAPAEAASAPTAPAELEHHAPPVAGEVPAEPWFEEERASVLDARPQAPVPLPPMLQELVHTSKEAEPESWFQAKEPPPEYSEEDLAQNAAATPTTEADDEDGTDADGQQRGRHSAAPDVSAVQRPN